MTEPATAKPAEETTTSEGRDLPAPANPQQSYGMAIYRKIGDPMDFIAKMGATLYESKMFGLANAAQGRALALAFMCKGIDPFDFKRRNHIIGGDVSMKAAAMLSDHHTLVGGDHTIIERTPQRAEIELTRGKKKNRFAFTWDEAKLEDYVWTKEANNGKIEKFLPNGDPNPPALKDNWSTPRRRMQMLWQRVVSDSVKAVSPEVNHGLYTPEELGASVDDDIIDAEYEITPPAPQAAAKSAEPEPAAEDAVVEPAAAESSEATQSAASTPAQEMLAEAAAGVDQEALRVELFKEVTRLKRELGTDSEKWKAFMLKNFQTESAKELPNDKLTALVERLRKNLEKHRAKGANATPAAAPNGNAVDGWANQAAGNQAPQATAEAPAGK